MPLNYDKTTGKWLDTYKGSVAKKDTRNPCALCGWGPHMGIHGVPEGTEPRGSLGLHSWVPLAQPAGQEPTE